MPRKKSAEKALKDYRKEAIKIAKDLHYSTKVIEDIKKAQNESQIATAMFVAMKGIDDGYDE